MRCFSGNFAEIMRFINDMARMKKRVEVTTYYLFLSVTDFLRIVINGLMSRIKFKESISFKGQDITFLTNLSLQQDYLLRRNWFFAYSVYYFAKKVLKKYDIKCFFYPFENHPWEKL